MIWLYTNSVHNNGFQCELVVHVSALHAFDDKILCLAMVPVVRSIRRGTPIPSFFAFSKSENAVPQNEIHLILRKFEPARTPSACWCYAVPDFS